MFHLFLFTVVASPHGHYLLQPKVTIALLDQDDLRSLAHLMNSYPSVLKEKALLAQAAASSK